MLLSYGDGIQNSEWFVADEKPSLYCRIYYIRGGSADYINFEEKKHLKKEHIYIFPAHLPYSIKHNPQDPIDCFWWHDRIDNIFSKDIIDIDCKNNPNLWQITLLFENAVRNNYKRSYLDKVSSLFVDQCWENNLLERADSRINEFMLYINNHYKVEFSVGQMCKAFGYTNEHLIRMFHSLFGVSPYQYVSILRLKDATQRLAGQQSIAEIAGLVGYNSAKSFSKAFKAYYGVSPSVYRKNLSFTA